MSVFFNGRLLVSPTTASVVDDSALANQNLSVGNVLAIIGASVGGQPNTALAFGSPDEAVAALISGDLVDAITRAFDPSSDVGAPETIIAIRVNPATQSSLNLLDAASNVVIALQSTDYGAYTTGIKVKVETASTTGKKLTTQFGNSYYSADNVYRNAFSIQYTGGQASAVMTVANSSLVLQAPTGTTVASIDLTQFPTIQQLVDRINVTSGFVATVLDGNGQKPALAGLDSVSAQDVKTSLYTATANLQAVVDWLNSTGEGYVTATRQPNAGAAPANLPFTYLTGGSDGVVTNTQWSNAFTTLQTSDVQWVVPLSGDPSIAAMCDAHVAYMSNVAQMERRSICGTTTGTSDANAIAAAKALNSDRTSLTHLGIYDYDANGDLILYAPMIAAAMIGGMFAGVNPATPLTNKTLKVRGLERNLRNPTDTDALIQGGVLCLQNTPQGYKIVQSISTWITNDNYNRVEQSVGAGYDYVARDVRDALDQLRGQKMSPILLGRAVNITESQLRAMAQPEPTGPGILVGDADSPPYQGITATANGDVLSVQFQASVALPDNYNLVTIFAQPFSGSASASAS